MTEDLERLYQTMYASVVRFLYRKVWDQDRAEDLAQEVFIRAMNHQPEKPRAWIFAVASNLARDEARAAVRRKKHLTLLTNDPVTLARPATGADDVVEQEEEMAHVQTALDSLKAASIVDIAQWRFIQHLADLRNMCDHGREPEPSAEQVDDLVKGVKKVTKTIY